LGQVFLIYFMYLFIDRGTDKEYPAIVIIRQINGTSNKPQIL